MKNDQRLVNLWAFEPGTRLKTPVIFPAGSANFGHDVSNSRDNFGRGDYFRRTSVRRLPNFSNRLRKHMSSTKRAIKFCMFSIHIFLFFIINFLYSSSDAESRALKSADKTMDKPIEPKYWKRGAILHFETENQTGIMVFNSPVLISNTTFASPFDFSNAKFMSRAVFNTVHFLSSVKFRTVTFWSGADFMDNTYDSSVKFEGARFQLSSCFIHSKFRSEAGFSGCTFGGDGLFLFSSFDSAADFGRSRFSDKADFSFAVFHSISDFWSARFDSIVNFQGTIFDSLAMFPFVNFGKRLNFRAAEFRGSASFFNSVLPLQLDFRDVTKVSGSIDFYSVRHPLQEGRCQIALYGSDINKIKLNMKIFKLWFPIDTLIYKTPHGDSLMIDSLIDDAKASVYETVLKKLKNDGLTESYEILDVDYREFKYQHKGWLGHFINLIQRWWWHYGYNGERVFLWSLFLWVFFSIINFARYHKLTADVYGIKFLEDLQEGTSSTSRKSTWSGVRTKAKFFGVRFLQAITYTGIIFFGLKMNLDKFRDGAVRNHPLLFAYLMIIYTSGIICLGFIVNQIFK